MADLYVIKGMTMTSTFYSIDEYVATAKASPEDSDRSVANSWFDDLTWNDAASMALAGWPDELDQAMEIAEHAIRLCESQHRVFTTYPVYDVCGADVDVARFLSGEPENMIEYPLTPVSRAGKVITLCAGLNLSAVISPETAKRRGYVITALALALQRLGHAVEIWADMSGTNHSGGHTYTTRVLIKGTDDVIEPGRLMFALAHPAFIRALNIRGVRKGIPDSAPQVYQRIRSGGSLPCNPAENLPDGTLYLPCLRSNHDVPDANEALEGYLREIGLLES